MISWRDYLPYEADEWGDAEALVYCIQSTAEGPTLPVNEAQISGHRRALWLLQDRALGWA